MSSANLLNEIEAGELAGAYRLPPAREGLRRNGPGPGPVSEAVARAFLSARNVDDHMKPPVLDDMKNIRLGLQKMFQTDERFCLMVPGNGYSANQFMYSAMIDSANDGAEVLIFDSGFFSHIDAQMISRLANSWGFKVKIVSCAKPGDPWLEEDMRPHFKSFYKRKVKRSGSRLAFIASHETGFGVVNDIPAFSKLCVEYKAEGGVDGVASEGIVETRFDDLPGIVGISSCPQKGLELYGTTLGLVVLRESVVERCIEHQPSALMLDPCYVGMHYGLTAKVPDEEDKFRILPLGEEAPGYSSTFGPEVVAHARAGVDRILREGMSDREDRFRFWGALLEEYFVNAGWSFLVKEGHRMPHLKVVGLPDDSKAAPSDFISACHKRKCGIWPVLGDPTPPFVRIGCLGDLASSQYIRWMLEVFEEVSLELDIPGATRGQAESLYNDYVGRVSYVPEPVPFEE